MALSILLAFAGGFFVGNGAPYYVAGSTGDGVNPSPFPQMPWVNVLVGWSGMVLGVVLCWLATPLDHPVASSSAIALGVLVVGLIHARLWRRNPWRTRPSAASHPR